MVDVFLISKTLVDWPKLQSITKQLLGRSLSEKLDARGINVGNLSSYLNILNELDATGAALRHVHYAFLVACDRETFIEIVRATGLSVSGDDDCSIISGNLETWRSAVINCSTGLESFDLRSFCNKCLSCMERDGLGSIFAAYQKIGMPDTSIKLIGKKP